MEEATICHSTLHLECFGQLVGESPSVARWTKGRQPHCECTYGSRSIATVDCIGCMVSHMPRVLLLLTNDLSHLWRHVSDCVLSCVYCLCIVDLCAACDGFYCVVVCAVRCVKAIVFGGVLLDSTLGLNVVGMLLQHLCIGYVAEAGSILAMINSQAEDGIMKNSCTVRHSSMGVRSTCMKREWASLFVTVSPSEHKNDKISESSLNKRKCC